MPDGQRRPVDKAVVSLGSDSGCDVIIRGAGVRPSHALLFRDGQGLSISPAAKGCEVRHNGRKVGTAALVAGDRITLGGVELLLEAGPASPASSGVSSPLPALLGLAGRLLAHRPPRELLAHALETLAQ